MAVAALKKTGWSLNNDKLKPELIHAGKEDLLLAKAGKKKELLNFLLNIDLAKVSDSILPTNISNLKQLKGPMVLQLTHWINVSHSILKNHQGSAGVCRLTLSDGYKEVFGFSDDALKNISGKTPYGSKTLLKSTIRVEGGLLVLNSSNTEFLGGEVAEFKSAWTTERLQLPSTTGLNTAPKWISVDRCQEKQAKQLEVDERCKNFNSFKVLKEIPWFTQQEKSEETETNVTFKRKRQEAVNAIDVPRKRPRYLFHRHW